MAQMQQREFRLAIPSPTKLLTPAVVTFLILMVIGFTLFIYAQMFMFENLALSRACFSQLKIWQLVSYAFINSPCSLAFNGIAVLFFGSAIERQWRTGATFLLAAVVVIICGFLWLLVSFALGSNFVGISSASLAYGFVGAFGVLFRKQRFWMFLWTLEAQTIAWIVIVIGLIYSIAQPLALVWISGALVAYLYIKARWTLQGNRGRSSSSHGEIRSGGFVDLD